MRVLKNNFDEVNTITTKIIKPYPRKLICQCCGSELEYIEDDIYVGVLGAAHITCPLCDHENMLDDNENSITLTKDNIEFPTHFYPPSEKAVDVCNNEEVKKFINKAINYFRVNKDAFAHYEESGNAHFAAYRFEGDEEYHIVIANSYYETFIPFELEDY